VVGEFREELRLTESTLSISLPESPLVLQGDAALLLNGVRACLGTAIALVELSGTPADIHVAAFASAETVHCEFRQDAYTLDTPQLARLFDMESTDRQGGRTMAVALGAAKRVAQLHGGSFDARPTTSGGCVFMFGLPAAVNATVAAKAN
jgi:K+-sensing histidine kinase KdpD